MAVSSAHPSRVAPVVMLPRVALCLVWLAASVGSAPAQAAELSRGIDEAPPDRAPASAPVAQDCQATFTVMDLTDGGAGSLRQALLEVCAGGVVNFNPNFAGQTIALSTTLQITQSLTIDGSGLTSNVKISGDSDGDGAGNVQVFNVTAGVAATLTHLDIISGTAEFGGGIHNAGTLTLNQSAVFSNSALVGGGLHNAGTLTLTQSAIHSNTVAVRYDGFGGLGGGLYNEGTATIANSTLSGNTATHRYGGGGLFNSGTATITNSTLSGNTARDGDGGGLAGWGGGTLYLQNSLVAGNRANHADRADCWGSMVSRGYNVAGLNTGCVITSTDQTTSDPRLGPPADNGGPTLTHALLPDSPAIDLIPFGVSGCGADYTHDQRGRPRPSLTGDACDAGAFEFADLAFTKAISPTENAPYHGVVTYTVRLKNASPDADPGVWLTDTLPASVAFESWVISPTNTVFDGTALTWQGALAPGAELTWTFQARHAGTYPERVVNTAILSGTRGLTQAEAAFQVCGSSITVLNKNDSGSGSLRQALVDVCRGGVVNFDGGLAGQTVALSSTLQLDKNVTIDGSSLTSHVKISGDSNADGAPDVGVFAIPAGVWATLTHLDIINGTAQDGGGIYNGGTLTLTQSTLSGNTAAFSGGGIDNHGTLTVTQSSVSGNSASVGGGIFNDVVLTVTRSTVSGNTAGNGGGIDNLGTLTVTQSTLAGNTAQRGGGLLNLSDATVISSTVSGNSATSYGGGIANNNILALLNSTVSGNAATQEGGRGGALDIWGDGPYEGRAIIVNSTIVSNTAFDTSTSGIWLAANAGASTIANSIVAQNGATNNVWVEDGTLTSLGYNLTNSGAGTPFTATTDLTGTVPLLGPLGDHGGGTLTHALLPGSPALDLIPFGVSGCGTDYTQDQRGEARPYPAGGACDAGAYERGRLTFVYLPLVRR